MHMQTCYIQFSSLLLDGQALERASEASRNIQIVCAEKKKNQSDKPISVQFLINLVELIQVAEKWIAVVMHKMKIRLLF